MGNQTSSVEVLQVTSKVDTSMFRFVAVLVLTVTLFATHANAATAVTSFNGAFVSESLEQGQSPGDITFVFVPQVAVAATNIVTITSGSAVFAADGPVNGVTATSDGSAAAVTSTAGSGTKTVIKVTMGATLAAGKLCTIKYLEADTANNVAAADVKYQIATSTDVTASTLTTMYATKDAATSLDFKARKQTLKAAVAGGDYYLKFTPVVNIAATTGTIKFTSDRDLWTADDSTGANTACTVTQVGIDGAKIKRINIPVTKTVISGTKKIQTITLGATGIAGGREVMVTCDGTKNMAVNEAVDQAVAVKMETTGDTTEVTSATKFTYKAGVAWTSATRATSQIVGVAGGDLVFTFTPTTNVAANDLVTLTASEGLFTADAATICTATSDGSAATVTGSTTTSTPADICTGTTVCDGAVAVKNILKVTMGATLTAAKVAVITCTTNFANNGATPGAVTFDIATTTDTGKLGKQTGYNLCAASQNVVSGVCTTPSSSSSANGAAAAAAASSNPHTTVKQAYTFPSLTTATYTGNTKGNMECAYANNVEDATTPTWCVAATGSRTYKAGIAMSSSVARRAATVTFTLKVDTTVLAKSALEAKVATSSTAAKFAAALTAVNTGTGFNITDPGTATNVATATYTSTGSGASSLLPSMLGLVSALFIALKHM